MEFNKLQEKIINQVKGVNVISAPVGTGKTTVLTERVIKALEAGIKPEEILCLTFTNRATEEMRGKLRERAPSPEILNNLTIKTFHGFCAYFIRAETELAGVATDFIIFDETERVEILEGILEKHPEYSPTEGEFFNKTSYLNGLLKKIYDYRLNKLEKEIGCQVGDYELDETLLKIGQEYRRALEEQNGLDFDELVFLTVQVLCTNEKARKKWSGKYKFIQVDEFQDTHLSEYLVVKELAKSHRNISFIGDLDQTIYSWRGSRPFFIINLVKHHFPEFKEFHLETNYRFNRYILEAVKSFLKSFSKSVTKNINSIHQEEGGEKEKKCIKVFGGYSLEEEVDWTVNSLQDIREKEPGARVAVLARTNFLIKNISQIFTQKGINHITVDKYEFFRKQEIKDIYAYLKIVFNRFDLESAYRLIKRPARNIGPATVREIREKGNPLGFKVSDFLNFASYNFSEPFENLIKQWQEGRIIVLDTETTGTNVLQDEIIQIYATEVIGGEKKQEFHFYLKNTIPVGSSYEVHGLTDEFLQEQGRDPTEVLKELKEFIKEDIVVGHNIIFDLSMIEENSKRLGLDFSFKEYYDTLDLSRRLLDSPNYKLTTLAQNLGLAEATHDARDDVWATVDLLGVLVEKLSPGQAGRAELFAKYSAKFIKLANLINSWQKVIKEKRPSEALEQIWQESGLRDYYSKEEEKKEERLNSFAQLKNLFAEKDDLNRPPEVVTKELVQYASFNKGVDFLALEKGEVPVVTPHQVKGLEFDYIFIIGVNDYKFPIRSQTSDLEEEKRLFYVSLTRARKNIFLSYSRFDGYNRPQSPSPFIGFIDKEFIDFVN